MLFSNDQLLIGSFAQLESGRGTASTISHSVNSNCPTAQSVRRSSKVEPEPLRRLSLAEDAQYSLQSHKILVAVLCTMTQYTIVLTTSIATTHRARTFCAPAHIKCRPIGRNAKSPIATVL